MAMAMPDPKALLEEVSNELKEAQDKAGLGNADAMVGKLDEIKAKAEAGPGDIIDKVAQSFESFMKQIDEAIQDPASLMAGGGMFASCAASFAQQVLDKLKTLKGKAEQLFQTIGDMAKSLANAFKDLGAALSKVMEVLAKQVKKLMGLPTELQETAGSVSTPEEFGAMDLTDIKAAIDTSGLSSVFDELGKVKGSLGPMMEGVADTMKTLGDFITDLPDQLSAAFETPVSKFGCSAGPQALQDLLAKVKTLKEVPLDSLLDTLDKTKESVSNMDVEAVKGPIETFAKSAADPIGKLEKGVSAAKAAGGMADAANAVGAIGGMFGK